MAYDASMADFSESSATEYAQEGWLVTMTMISFVAAKIYRRHHLINFSFGLLSLAFLVREYDNFAYDYLFPYAWPTLVILILAFLAVFVFRNLDQIKQEFTAASSTYAFAFALTGVLFLQVYSDYTDSPLDGKA